MSINVFAQLTQMGQPSDHEIVCELGGGGERPRGDWKKLTSTARATDELLPGTQPEPSRAEPANQSRDRGRAGAIASTRRVICSSTLQIAPGQQQIGPTNSIGSAGELNWSESDGRPSASGSKWPARVEWSRGVWESRNELSGVALWAPTSDINKRTGRTSCNGGRQWSWSAGSSSLSASVCGRARWPSKHPAVQPAPPTSSMSGVDTQMNDK